MNSPTTTPVAISGLSSGVTAISAHGYHTCALTSAGAVECWGYDAYGELGDGTTTNKRSPVAVSGLSSGVTAISAGEHHTCALSSAGVVKCWGDNEFGQLGDGTTTTKITPVPVSGLSSVIAISTGGSHTCMLTSAGAVKCWGDNGDGQLGDGTTANKTTAVPVSGLNSGVIAISAGDFHTCALTGAGAVECWGYNAFGELGDGTTTTKMTPVAVSGLSSGVVAISAGGYHTCALTSARRSRVLGLQRIWPARQRDDHQQTDAGRRQRPGQRHHRDKCRPLPHLRADQRRRGRVLGRQRIWRPRPRHVRGGNDAGRRQWPEQRRHRYQCRSLSTCALTSAGAVKCWGYNGSGQLGDGTFTEKPTPVAVSGLSSGVTTISAGGLHTCVLASAGAVKCWGYNGSGQLGDGTFTEKPTPVAVSGLSSGAIAIGAGGLHSCALTSVGAAECWGENKYGELGDGTTTTKATPVAVIGLSRVTCTTNTGTVTLLAGPVGHSDGADNEDQRDAVGVRRRGVHGGQVHRDAQNSRRSAVLGAVSGRRRDRRGEIQMDAEGESREGDAEGAPVRSAGGRLRRRSGQRLLCAADALWDRVAELYRRSDMRHEKGQERHLQRLGGQLRIGGRCCDAAPFSIVQHIRRSRRSTGAARHERVRQLSGISASVEALPAGGKRVLFIADPAICREFAAGLPDDRLKSTQRIVANLKSLQIAISKLGSAPLGDSAPRQGPRAKSPQI